MIAELIEAHDFDAAAAEFLRLPINEANQNLLRVILKQAYAEGRLAAVSELKISLVGYGETAQP